MSPYWSRISRLTSPTDGKQILFSYVHPHRRRSPFPNIGRRGNHVLKKGWWDIDKQMTTLMPRRWGRWRRGGYWTGSRYSWAIQIENTAQNYVSLKWIILTAKADPVTSSRSVKGTWNLLQDHNSPPWKKMTSLTDPLTSVMWRDCIIWVDLITEPLPQQYNKPQDCTARRQCQIINTRTKAWGEQQT